MQIQTNPVAAAIAPTMVGEQRSRSTETEQSVAVPRQKADQLRQLGEESNAQSPNNDQVKEAVEKVNEVVGSFERGLEFTVDDETNIRVVKVVDIETKEVIRQIPSEEVINIAKAIDRLQGLLLRDQA
jgi:flagellar protein FlaG